MSKACYKINHGNFYPESDCPYCEIDRLNKEINRLRQYEDAITSAIDGTLLVWNLMSTNHTVIKNDYWQNHLEEIERLKAELEEWQETAKLAERRTYTYGEECKQLRIDLEESNENHTFYKSHSQDLERQLAEARAEVERYKAGVEVVGHVCMQELGASVPGLSAALLAYPHNVRVLIMKLEG